MENQILVDLLQTRKYKTARDIFEVMNAIDIASVLSDLEENKELAVAFRLIPKDKAADVFTEMGDSMQAYLINAFTESELRDILEDLYLDDTVDILEDLPANLVTRILDQVSPQDRKTINTLLNYPEDSAGSIMTTEYVALRSTTTVKRALEHIREVGIHKETIYTCYVLEQRKLVGIVTAKNLLTSADNVTMEELMETEIISVSTHTDQEEVAKLFSKYGLLALPVLDVDEHMVGIVTFDDAIDVMEDETTEDITKMAAMNPNEDTYFETSVFTHAKNRIPWLLFLMFSASITGSIINGYQESFSAIPMLVAFIPMLMDTGGNCGAQSSTLMIRGIALDEIQFKDLFKVMFKEFRVALVVSAFLALANGTRIFIMYRDLKMSVVVAASLIATIIIAKLIGCSLPLLAKRIHLDPALMASPLITTIVDTCSILIYFNIATYAFGL